MSSLDWFYRMEHALRNSLPEMEEVFNPYDIYLEGNITEFHPSFTFTVDIEDDEKEFCSILFDPVNQEFYSYYYNDLLDLDSKILLNDLEEMLDYIRTRFYELLDEMDLEDLEWEEYIKYSSETVKEEDKEQNGEEEIILGPSEDDIEWISNDKHVHIETTNDLGRNEYMIHLKVGMDKETGDGILYRNILAVGDEDEDEEERMFIPFKPEEAEYIIQLMEDYLLYIEKN